MLFCHIRKVWFKKCSCCEIDTIGTNDYKESRTIIETMFSSSFGSSQSHDGLQSRCWICNSHRRRELGVNRIQLEQVLAQQDNHCAICDIEISIARNAINPANVDHDEISNEVRALLCGDCNRAIGLLKHNPHTLRLAADYCAHHSKIIKLRCA